MSVPKQSPLKWKSASNVFNVLDLFDVLYILKTYLHSDGLVRQRKHRGGEALEIYIFLTFFKNNSWVTWDTIFFTNIFIFLIIITITTVILLLLLYDD